MRIINFDEFGVTNCPMALRRTKEECRGCECWKPEYVDNLNRIIFRETCGYGIKYPEPSDKDLVGVK